MNSKIYTSIALGTAGAIAAAFMFSNSNYQTREKNNLVEIKKRKVGHEASMGAILEKNDLRVNQITGTVDYNDFLSAKNDVRKASLRRVAKDLSWEELGPDNVGGRTRVILIDKDDPSVMYMGAVSGGFWKSTTKGTSWKKVSTDDLNLHVVSGTQTANGDVYYGTGEGGFVSINGVKNGTPGFRGNGVFRSTDGENFTKLTSTNSGIWTNVHKMASDPTDANTLYACNSGGFYVSSNGGTSWTRPQSGPSRDVQVASNGHLYMNIGNRIWKSTDKGQSVQQTGFNVAATSPTYNVGRMTIAVSPEDANYVYLLITNTQGGFEGLVRTTDGGDNWEELVAGGSIYDEIMGSNGQGNYNNIISVDPKNKNRVFMGGVEMAEWDSERGYTKIASTFVSRANPRYVHADKHAMVWDVTSNPPVFWIGTDGGLFRSGNMNDANYGYIFSEQNRGYITTQYYGLAASADGTVMGGTQDNGTQLINGNGNTNKSAVRVYGGDGFQSEIARTNPNVIFAESQYGNMQRSVNGGQSFSPIWDGRIADPATLERSTEPTDAPFDTYFRIWEDENDSSNSKFYFAPYGQLWVATNPLDVVNRPIWFAITPNYGGARVTSIDFTPDGGSVFYSTAQGALIRVDSINEANFDTAAYPNATDVPAKLNSVNIKGNLPGGRAITSIAIDPGNPNKALVTLGNYGNSAYVYVSNNVLSASPTWTNVTNNLPRMPVYHGLILIDNSNYFVLATEMGIWASDDNGATWEVQADGLPSNVASYIVRQYEFKPWEGPRVYVATHGRGFFRSNTFLTDIEKPKTDISTTSIKAFPNPTSDVLNISFNSNVKGVITYNIFNLNGKRVYKANNTIQSGTVEKTIDVRNLPKGTYILNIESNGTQVAKKFVVN